MNKNNVLNKIKDLGLLAVIRGPSVDLTLKLVEALIAGGVLGIEITYTTPNAEEVVHRIDQEFSGEVLLGMGTLTEPDQPLAAKEAGAQFLVSPMIEETLINNMVSSGLTSMAGALTPTEIFTAYKKGIDVVKVFPGSVGGPKYLKAIKGPFPYIPLMPTGGVSLNNISEWFSVGAIAVGAGSALCPNQMVRNKEFKEITQIAKKFTSAVQASKTGVQK